jgi:hypothetical protein
MKEKDLISDCCDRRFTYGITSKTFVCSACGKPCQIDEDANEPVL